MIPRILCSVHIMILNDYNLKALFEVILRNLECIEPSVFVAMVPFVFIDHGSIHFCKLASKNNLGQVCLCLGKTF